MMLIMINNKCTLRSSDQAAVESSSFTSTHYWPRTTVPAVCPPPPAALPPSPAVQPLQRPPVAPPYGPFTEMQIAVQFAPWVDIDPDYKEEKK